MKKVIFLCCLFHLLTMTLVCQTLSVFDIDTSNFPTMKAKFFAFDKEGQQITNLSPSDFTLTEDGIQRTVTRVSCPAPKPVVPISSVLTIDVSSSMEGEGLKIAQLGASTWVNALNLGISECAITSFSDKSYLNQDFTNQKQILLDKIVLFTSLNGTNYDEAFLNQYSGAIQVALNGKNKRIIIFLSDGYPKFEPQTSRIIQVCQQYQISVFSVVVSMSAPQCLKDISEQTGGQYFENVSTEARIKEIYLRILQIIQNSETCDIEWQSDKNCVTYRSCYALIKPINLQSNFVYFISNNNFAKIEYSPSPSMSFDTISPPNSQTKNITITARNKDILINNVTISNPEFQIIDWGGSPPPFTLPENQSRIIKVQFSPNKIGYAFCRFEFESNACSGNSFFARTSFIFDTSVNKTLILTHPNGGESFLVGTDTVITWDGVLPSDTVSLDYSINSGAKWKSITTSALNLEFNWKKIPSPPSTQCIMRVKSRGNPVAFGDLISTLVGHTKFVISIAFSPDGMKIASGSYDETIKLWDISIGNVINTFSGHTDVITSIAFSPDGTKLASGSFDHTIKIWETNSGNLINTFLGHSVVVISVVFSTNGSMLASGSGDSTIKIWDINSGTIIKTFIGHTGRVRTVTFSPDGLLLASGGNDSTIRLWSMDNNGNVQEDISDSLWSIVTPQAAAVDIDMKQALVGTVKDSVITGFITNSGSYPCRIDSIYFEGGDNNQFAHVSGFPPFNVDVGTSKAVELRFKPNSVGNKSSTIVIITQADTLRQTIIGEGTLPQLQVMTNILDFGKVELGSEKTFQDTLLLKNINTSPIDITNTELMYPDTEQFNILSGGGAFTLNPGESRPLTVQFKPKYGGRTSGGIGFDYAGTSSPATVVLFGEGIGGMVTIPDDSAKVGETRELKMIFSKVKMDGIQAIATNFMSKVRFQRTILAPIDRKSISTFSNDSIIINISGDIGSSTELASVPVVAALGSVTETTLDLIEFTLYNAGNNIVDYDIETRSGKFKILGICEEGGKRLLDFSGNVKLFLVNPNPASDEAEIEFELIERERTQLFLTNILGETVITLLDGIPELGRQRIRINTNDLPQGNYFVILKTPTIIKTQRVGIVK